MRWRTPLDPEDQPTAAVWLRARRALALELVPLVASGAALIGLAPRAEASVPDARVLFLAALALFSIGLLDAMRRTLEVLDWDCPRCHENFCGPLPFRARCSYCGHRPAPDAARIDPRS